MYFLGLLAEMQGHSSSNKHTQLALRPCLLNPMKEPKTPWRNGWFLELGQGKNKMSLECLRVSQSKKCSKIKRIRHVKGTQKTNWKSFQAPKLKQLSNKINNDSIGLNPKYKMHIHEFIWYEQMTEWVIREKNHIFCIEESQIYIDNTPLQEVEASCILALATQSWKNKGEKSNFTTKKLTYTILTR